MACRACGYGGSNRAMPVRIIESGQQSLRPVPESRLTVDRRVRQLRNDLAKRRLFDVVSALTRRGAAGQPVDIKDVPGGKGTRGGTDPESTPIGGLTGSATGAIGGRVFENAVRDILGLDPLPRVDLGEVFGSKPTPAIPPPDDRYPGGWIPGIDSTTGFGTHVIERLRQELEGVLRNSPGGIPAGHGPVPQEVLDLFGIGPGRGSSGQGGGGSGGSGAGGTSESSGEQGGWSGSGNQGGQDWTDFQPGLHEPDKPSSGWGDHVVPPAEPEEAVAFDPQGGSAGNPNIRTDSGWVIRPRGAAGYDPEGGGGGGGSGRGPQIRGPRGPLSQQDPEGTGADSRRGGRRTPGVRGPGFPFSRPAPDDPFGPGGPAARPDTLLLALLLAAGLYR